MNEKIEFAIVLFIGFLFFCVVVFIAINDPYPNTQTGKFQRSQQSYEEPK